MKNLIFFLSVFCLSSFSPSYALAEITWENPPVLCPEDTLPRGLPCLDLSRVSDPFVDFPEGLSIEEINEWNTKNLADLKLCRHTEILRREKAHPGTYSEGNLRSAWLVVDGGKESEEKLKVILKVSRDLQIPPLILIGALKQESYLSSIGVQPDGGNYSCGIAQLNINEWCENMNALTVDERHLLGWPSIACDTMSLPTESVKSLYDLALKNLEAGKRGYEMQAQDYEKISASDVSIPETLFRATKSYLAHCQDFHYSILFKARLLKNLFDQFVPKKLKSSELIDEGLPLEHKCHQNVQTKHFPLHTGWLLTTAMYNAGPVQAKLVGHYFKVQNYDFPAINPLDLIEALHWGGKWKEGTDLISFRDQAGREFSQRWFKSCIAQRHVARVIQHVSAPGVSIANSLEKEGCKSTVPEYRKLTSGVKDSLRPTE